MTIARKNLLVGLMAVGGFWLVATKFIGSWQDATAALGLFCILLAVAVAGGDKDQPRDR